MNTEITKRIPLEEVHESLGAKMVNYAGYMMPVQYQGLKEEHAAVRENVGIFDVSHMGEFIVEGTAAKNLLQKITTNDVDKLTIGKVQYSCMPNLDGGIIDDLLVYQLAENKYMLVVNASNIAKDIEWINSQNTFDCTVKNVSEEYALFAIQGPNAAKVIEPLTSMNVSNMKYYTFEQGIFAGDSDTIVSATGYTGAGGFEVYVPVQNAEMVFDEILKEGEKHHLALCGLAARDTLRLEMGFCLYGNDINEETSPIEAGLSWITKFSKSFNSDNIFKEQKEVGVTKKLRGFQMIEKGIPRKDYDIVSKDGTKIGQVTSGTMSPSLGYGIGMGYIDSAFSKFGTEIYIQVRKKQVSAKVVKLPFYQQ